ncbi:MAG: pantetheine-phosphate adenylyltransferase [Bacteroidota bacterium]
MEKIAVFPGSFDPVTRGHESIIQRALPLFDKIVIAVGVNAGKSSLFSLDKRIAFLKKVFENEPKVSIDSYEGLTVSFCKKIGAQFILRGMRTSADFEFERSIAQMNHAMDSGIETIFMVSDPALCMINSTIIRDIYKNGGDVSPFIPEGLKLS